MLPKVLRVDHRVDRIGTRQPNQQACFRVHYKTKDPNVQSWIIVGRVRVGKLPEFM